VSSPGSVGITSPVDLTPYRDFIPKLAGASADFVRPYFNNPELMVETKSDATPVTAADRGAEAVLRQLINTKFPAHGIVGEEHGSENPDAEFVWVLDPIDGFGAPSSPCCIKANPCSVAFINRFSANSCSATAGRPR
jgi:hypothetical protein